MTRLPKLVTTTRKKAMRKRRRLTDPNGGVKKFKWHFLFEIL
jgi:hypothetical protein